jgi:hypothetical protein
VLEDSSTRKNALFKHHIQKVEGVQVSIVGDLKLSPTNIRRPLADNIHFHSPYVQIAQEL